MRTVGIRVAPKVVTFVVFDKTKKSILNIEGIKIPAALEVPEALKFVRSSVLDILREYEISHAGIRVTESNAQTTSIVRIQIEGVILEAFASSQLRSYYVGQISSISSRIGIQRSRFKEIVDGANDLNIEDWETMKKEAREATLCAMGAGNA